MDSDTEKLYHRKVLYIGAELLFSIARISWLMLIMYMVEELWL